ncbi:MAG TPA: hypothetical protein PLD47_02935 [Aggregatilineales bacterium]|nr:hypothetical protein [Anaerolineales bacterium]HRE46655.1 hypothetical protein [Aggregatilineales bacterium]
MTQQVTLIGGVLTVRLNGHVSALEVGQAVQTHLLQQKTPVTLIVDMTFATALHQNLKMLFFRLFQHPLVGQVGVVSSSPVLAVELNDLANALARIRKVTVAATESELLVTFGLAEPPTQPKKLSSMLAHLKRADTSPQ